MKYTMKRFKELYPDDDACLERVFQNRYGDMKVCPKCGKDSKFYRVKKRQCYACMYCGKQLFPLSNTIFRSSTTSLWNWFYAVFQFSTHKNGVSAKTLERELGVTYKTAWRMAKQIRILMEDDSDILGVTGNPVEIDEVEYGHQGKSKNTKAFIAIERGHKAKSQVTDWVSTNRAMTFIRANMEVGIELYSDGSYIYKWTDKEYRHYSVIHGKKQWTRGTVNVNSVEGIWSFIEACINGTYRGISPKYLQHYLDEFIYRYNHKDEAICPLLLEAVGKPS
jgi:transposase-like protein